MLWRGIHNINFFARVTLIPRVVCCVVIQTVVCALSLSLVLQSYDSLHCGYGHHGRRVARRVRRNAVIRRGGGWFPAAGSTGGGRSSSVFLPKYCSFDVFGMDSGLGAADEQLHREMNGCIKILQPNASANASADASEKP